MARLQRIIDRLELKEFQLRALLDVTKAINNNVEQEALLKLYKDGKISKEEMDDFKKQMGERASHRPPPPPPPAEITGASEAYGQTYQLGAKASAGTTYSQAA